MSPWYAVNRAELSASLRLPPRASASIPIVSWTSLLARAGLADGQRPSPKCRPIQPGNGSLGLGGVGHLDKAKAPRAARGPIRDDPDALDTAIRLEQCTQLFFGGRIRQIRDIDVHGALLRCSSLWSTPWWPITAGVFSPCQSDRGVLSIRAHHTSRALVPRVRRPQARATNSSGARHARSDHKTPPPPPGRRRSVRRLPSGAGDLPRRGPPQSYRL